MWHLFILILKDSVGVIYLTLFFFFALSILVDFLVDLFHRSNCCSNCIAQLVCTSI